MAFFFYKGAFYKKLNMYKNFLNQICILYKIICEGQINNTQITNNFFFKLLTNEWTIKIYKQ